MSWRRGADTFGRRLFLLMWGALVVSHLLAFLSVQVVMRLRHDGPRPAMPPPTFPSLPPTPGLHQLEAAARSALGAPPGVPARPPGAARDEAAAHHPGGAPDGPPRPSAAGPPPGEPGAGPPPPGPRPPGPGGPLPPDLLALDYGVRLLVIGLAAAWGGAWVARPLRRLEAAAASLGQALGQAEGEPEAPAGAGDPTPAPAEDAPLDEAHGPREVRTLARVFNRMAASLRAQFNARSLMVAAISHDLRTPLTRLRMRLETPGLDPELRARSVADLQAMNALIDGALEVFRRDAGGPAEPWLRTDVAALAQALVDDLAEQGQPVRGEVEPGAGAVITTQPLALQRVLGNLLGNALRHGGSATLRLRLQAERLSLEVEDEGPGIPPELLDKVFEPFFRVEASRHRASGGSGLGLHIARDLTQRLGGRLSLANRPEGGLRATVVLPRRG